jgi:hypothetical protein
MSVYIASTKTGARLSQTTAHESPESAREWVEERVASDTMMDGPFEWQSFRKDVYQSDNGDVYGTVQTVEWADDVDDQLVEQR